MPPLENQRRNSGVCLGVCFSRQSTTSSKSVTGSDARFPSKVRQIDVIGLCYVLICNQEVAGSIPVRSIDSCTIIILLRVSHNGALSTKKTGRERDAHAEDPFSLALGVEIHGAGPQQVVEGNQSE